MTETMDEVLTHRAFCPVCSNRNQRCRVRPAGEVPGALILINAESQADVEQILNQDSLYVAEVIQARLIRRVKSRHPGKQHEAGAGFPPACVVSTQLLLEGASELSGVKDALSDFNEQAAPAPTHRMRKSLCVVGATVEKK